MRFLTNSEAKKWIAAQGLPFKPTAPPDHQFEIADEKDNGEAARRAILELCATSSQKLLLIEDHPLTRDDRRERFAAIRSLHGENKFLSQAPAILTRSSDDFDLSGFLEVCIGPGSWWTLWVYLAKQGAFLSTWESSVLDLWSPRGNDSQIVSKHLRETMNA